MKGRGIRGVPRRSHTTLSLTNNAMLSLTTTLLFALGLFTLPCQHATARTSAEEPEHGRLAESLADAPLARERRELLEIAYEAASAFPLHPHVRNRARAQEQVVLACLELNQRARALHYIEGITNWRRGAGYADLAFHCAERGERGPIAELLARADEVARGEDDGTELAWRMDRIRAKIAQTHAFLGEDEAVAALEAGLAPNEAGRIGSVRAMVSDETTFASEFSSLEAVFATGDFDLVRNGLDAAARLFDRFYSEEARRERVERLIRSSWVKTPLQIRIQTLFQLAEAALEHGDLARASALVTDARSVLDSAPWLAEHYVPLLARVAALRFRAGEAATARKEAAEALAAFEQGRDTIVDIYRAGALRPLAEAYLTLGAKETASAIYGQALQEGVRNPNARPRANDLVATCVSMAIHGFAEPDLTERIRAIRAGLGDPW